MSVQDQLNRSMPAAHHAKLGDVLAELLDQVNRLKVRLTHGMLTKAGLVIKAGSSAIVKAGSAILANVGGTLVYKAANTDMAALAGTLATAKSAVWMFYTDAAGTLSSAKTADAASVAAAIALIPKVPDDKAMIGAVVVSNATGADFVGGTTALDAASVTAVYLDVTGPAVIGADAAIVTLEGLETRA